LNLQELLEKLAKPSIKGVPNWMVGYFKRYSISFADGLTDLETNVFWLQSRNFTIDLRLPILSQQVVAKSWEEYSTEELEIIGDYEGWAALCDWSNETLSWRKSEASLQLHNRWSEPAILKRIGNCMIEFSPSGSYVEDWRLQPSKSGPLIGLRLVEERNIKTNQVNHLGGGVIICGDYAGLVLGRGNNISTSSQEYNLLRTMAVEAHKNYKQLSLLFNFETSLAQGSISEGYKIIMSTLPSRVGQPLFDTNGFEYDSTTKLIKQKFTVGNQLMERIFTIDTIEQNVDFQQNTNFTSESDEWYKREQQTLDRYSKPLF